MKYLMKINLFSVLVCLASFASAGNLCNLPSGNYLGMSKVTLDRSTDKVEQFQVELKVGSDNNSFGYIKLYELDMDSSGTLHHNLIKNEYFTLSGCSSGATFNLKGPEIEGFLKVMNVNQSMGEITMTGAINTYEEGLYGVAQWLYDSAGSMVGSEGKYEIDFRKLPIRLRKQI
ncbi:hypothetical protein [Endozoicomonas sp. 8E]|uniref:hypothetical protein n=1 Tax=Endozoicomonas sp. 8E TaxID=3035692 RepID=UPI002938D065|nr:hypothetical protein [Endozoicomonas sp. 8E]WOG26565.1 hypothetical protein P6910_18735 [Endozoicomonas sp. 8E]